jgi:hypothetical protein
MKPFLPFLLIPLTAVAGWMLADSDPLAEGIYTPTITAIAAPPSIGNSVALPPTDGPIWVRMRALLPPPGTPVLRADGPPQATPEVTAIMIHGPRRVAQIDGIAMVVGEARGLYRIAAIEPNRVLFVQTALGLKRWIPVNDQQ